MTRVPTLPPVAVPETDPRTANTPIPWASVQAIARDLRAVLFRIVNTDPRDGVHPHVRTEAARVACSLLDALISSSPQVDATPWRAELRKIATLENQIRWMWCCLSLVGTAALLALVEVVSLLDRLTP